MTTNAERVFDVVMNVTVRVKVNDESAISRCVNNEDGWRDNFYDFDTQDKVLEAFAFNAILNREENIRRLDGWADLPPEAVTMEVLRDAELDYVIEAAGSEVKQ